jgi:cytochrome c
MNQCDAPRHAPVARWPHCVALAFAALLAGTACTRPAGEDRALIEVPGGDPRQGRALIAHYGCNGCHIVPGVRDIEGLVGPPLIHWSRRIYIAGRVHNTPDNLVHWIQAPQEIDPRTAMPNVGATAQEARHIAAYLFTLR